jgi:hypothetical protein
MLSPTFTAYQQARLQQWHELVRLAGRTLPTHGHPLRRWATVMALQATLGLDQPKDWSEPSRWHWEALLYYQPQLAPKVPNWNMFLRSQWLTLLAKHPQLINYLPNKIRLRPEDREYLLRGQPQLAQHPRLAGPRKTRATKGMPQAQGG